MNRGSVKKNRKNKVKEEEEEKERKGWRKAGILSWGGKRIVEVSPCSHLHRTH